MEQAGTEAAADRGGDLSSVLSVVEAMESAATGETTTMRRAVQALGEASFVPVLMAPALAVVTPLSGIPLFSSLCGILIALVSLQLLVNRSHIWLPDWLLRRKISSRRLREATGKMKAPARWLDTHSRERLGFLVHRPFNWITEVACLLCGASMPFLELVPFSSSILGAAVVLFSMALLVRDGLFALFAFLFVGGAFFVVYSVVLS